MRKNIFHGDIAFLAANNILSRILYMFILSLLQKRAFFLQKYVNRGMAFHRFVAYSWERPP